MLLLENTAGTQGPLGRDFDELGELLSMLDGDARVGVCLDCCHLLASGFEIRDAELADGGGRRVRRKRRARPTALPARQRLADPAGRQPRPAREPRRGELGERGIATFLSEPRFEELPALLETPGPAGRARTAHEVELAQSCARAESPPAKSGRR